MVVQLAVRALGSRYEIRRAIGSGSMGQVWLAWDRVAGREVAAKVLHTHLTEDSAMLSRFVQERSILLELRHPNIVEVYDMVVEGDDFAIMMELVGGGCGTVLKTVL